MTIAEALIAEMDQEAEATRRCLERVPEDKLGWKPHEKSLSLGRLAHHLATTPGEMAQSMAGGGMELADFPEELYPTVESAASLVPALEESLASAREVLSAMSDEDFMSSWRMTAGGTEMMTMPKMAVARSMMLNHWYHHRGQLTVYLRELDVAVPAIYGPSADDNPWEEAMKSMRAGG